MADAFGVVKVGNSAWGFLKLTPLSRIAAIVGACSGVTIRARNPSGTNRTTLCGWSAMAGGVIAKTLSVRPHAKATLLGCGTVPDLQCTGVERMCPQPNNGL